MSQPRDEHLSRISTMWTMLRQAHQSTDGDAAEQARVAARQELMQRYCGAVYRYLLAAVRDVHQAEDLTQEFALRFVSGRFKQADPDRGRFRDYVKASLFRLVADHRRRSGGSKEKVPLDGHEPVAPESSWLPADDRAFADSWRQELLSRAWQALAEAQQRTGQPCYDVLRLRVEQSELASPQLAEKLSEKVGKPISAVNVRQLLHRARAKFAELLLEETRHSLGGDADEERLREELAELNLLKYCRDALDGGQAG
jgi:RNA polymerase sigma factor (sigma-70 family)